jgi:Fe-S cluster assembly protein SufD
MVDFVNLTDGRLAKDVLSASHLLLTIKDNQVHLDVKVEEGSSLILEMVDGRSEEGCLIIDGHIDLEKNASLKVVFVSFSSYDLKMCVSSLLKEGARANYDIASSSDKKADKIFDIQVKHQEKQSYSFTRMYGVLLDQASLTFLGSSDIVKGAKKTWTRQEGRIADLSNGGKGQVSPILKIDEDDVKASHGAALGKVSEDSLFYMMSRGLSKKQAMALLTIGYLKPIVMEISDDNTRNLLLNYVEKRNFIND